MMEEEPLITSCCKGRGSVTDKPQGTRQARQWWPDFTGHQLTLAKLLGFFCWSSLLLNKESFDGGKTSFFQVQDDLSWMRKTMVKEGRKAGLASIWQRLLFNRLLGWLYYYCKEETGSYSIAQANPEHTIKPRMASKSGKPSYFSVHRTGMIGVSHQTSSQLLIFQTPTFPVLHTNVALRSQDYVRSKGAKR